MPESGDSIPPRTAARLMMPTQRRRTARRWAIGATTYPLSFSAVCAVRMTVGSGVALRRGFVRLPVDRRLSGRPDDVFGRDHDLAGAAALALGEVR